MSQPLEFRALGPVEVSQRDQILPVARGKEQSLLALLLLHRNQVVPTDRLIDELWSGERPRTAQTALHGYVGKLRRLLGRDRLVTHGAGYLLRVDGGELDVERFELMLNDGRAAEALTLWRGPPFFEVRDDPFAQAEIGRLAELRLVALERTLETKVEDGRADEAVSELEVLVREQPYRERLRALLMLALYRVGRQADALAAYRDMRRSFVDELGIEPSSEVRRLEQRILEQDPSLAAPEQPTRVEEEAPPAAPREDRKVVTVGYCELVGSTELSDRLDAEEFQALVERFVDACAGVVESHGGEVAAVSADAVIATFGASLAREDDALRGLRASAQVTAAVAPLGLEVRVGVATGELVVGGRLQAPIGDAVNVAARLHASTTPGVVLLDEATYLRCRDAVSVEEVSVGLQGKPEPVTAYELRSIAQDATPFRRRLDAPLVGREQELEELEDILDRVVRRRTPFVMTLLGAPGLGKTRLAREFSAALEEQAQVLVVDCGASEPGAAYGPLHQLVLEGFGAETAVERITELLEDDPDARAVANELLLAVGLAEGPTTREGTLWAFRRVIRALARQAPLVVVLEDAHWAEETFLDLLGQVLDSTTDVPLLVLCLARPEFADDRAGWLGRRRNAVSLRLEPLSALEARAHVDHLAQGTDPDLRARVVDAAAGNPLFAEQLLSHAVESGGTVETPATIEALLAARIDALGEAERAAVGGAAVVGVEFTLAQVGELMPAELQDETSHAVGGLVRRDLARPEPSRDAFRFSHALVRDAAYAGMLKRTRAELHERFAAWLERHPRGQEALIGTQLELACHSLADVGGDETRREEIAGRAAHWLGAAGGNAVRLGDVAGAEALGTRALALAGRDDPGRPELLLMLGSALTGQRRNPEAGEVFAEAAELARRLDDSGARGRAELYLVEARAREGDLDPRDLDEMEAEARAAALAFETAGDDRGAYTAWGAVHMVLYLQGHYAGALEAVERAIALGRKSGQLEARLLSRPMLLHLYGPTPSSRGLEHAAELLAADLDAASTADALAYGGVFYAMRGDPERGRAWVEQSQVLWREVGADAGGWFGEEGNLNVLAADWPAAEATLRAQCELLARPGLEHVFATYAATLAEVLVELGRETEAEKWAEESGRRAAPYDLPAQAAWRAAKARALAGRGRFTEAEPLAREAAGFADRADDLWIRGDVRLALSAVLASGGRPIDAAKAARSALATYEEKEHLVGIRRAQSALAGLGGTAALR